MRKKVFCLATLSVVSLFLFCSCSAHASELPEPEELFSEIANSVTLPEMTNVADEYLDSVLGLSPEDCNGAVYYLLSEGIAPDEIVIIRAKDDSSAEDIQNKLEDRLAYKEQAAQMYLTEYMPIIQAGFVRRDGLTLSLIVSQQSEQILEVYEQYK